MVAGLPGHVRSMARKMKREDVYARAYKRIMDESGRSSSDMESFTGMVRLNCALSGMDLVPYSNLQDCEREAFWKWILLSDGEQYWVVPYPGFYGELENVQPR